MTLSLIKRPVALAPFIMSAAALALVIGQIVVAGTARQSDEGAAAHLWQILMAAEVPVIAFFAITGLPRAARQTAFVLALQLAAAAIAALPVFLLGW